MPRTTRVLLVDDDSDLRKLVAGDLEDRGLDVRACGSAAAALEELDLADFDVVLTDVAMPEVSGLELCRRIRRIRPHVPVVLLTALKDFDTALAALRAGADDYLVKPVEPDEMARRVVRAAEHAALTAEVGRLRSEVAALREGVGGIVGESSAILEVLDLVDRVARTDVSVIVVGETGSGKELVARAIHEASRRAKGPFVAVNVAAVPDTLLESELFGHVKGSFTGAHKDHDGLFVKATGGTMLLDEVGEMPLEMQAALLRALEEGIVRPVGSDTTRRFDARVIAATHRDLEAEMAAGRFREDLFYRLNVVTIEVPPLRDRGNDVLLLAQYFVRRFAARHGVEVKGIDPEAAKRLMRYRWPGNIRELKNAIERAVALARYDQIGVEDLPGRVQQGRTPSVDIAESVVPGGELLPLDDVVRRHVEYVLASVDGSRTMAAELLGVDRKTLYRRLKKYEDEDREAER